MNDVSVALYWSSVFYILS